VYAHFVNRSNHNLVNGKEDEIFTQKMNVAEKICACIIVICLGMFIPTLIKAISTTLILQSDRALHSFAEKENQKKRMLMKRGKHRPDKTYCISWCKENIGKDKKDK
jgi:hypothetical protein